MGPGTSPAESHPAAPENVNQIAETKNGDQPAVTKSEARSSVDALPAQQPDAWSGTGCRHHDPWSTAQSSSWGSDSWGQEKTDNAKKDTSKSWADWVAKTSEASKKS